MSTNPIHYEKDRIINPQIGDIVETRSGELVRIFDAELCFKYNPDTRSYTTQEYYAVTPLDESMLLFNIQDVYKPGTPMWGEKDFVIGDGFSELFD